METSTALDRLAQLLRTPGLPPQKVVAAGAKVDQGLVSRARNGLLKRMTPRVERLLAYANMRVGELKQVPATGEVRRVGAKQPIQPRRRREDVLQHVGRYLADGFDGTLLIQQLHVLRQAQSSRAGRPPKRP